MKAIPEYQTSDIEVHVADSADNSLQNSAGLPASTKKPALGGKSGYATPKRAL
jgi:hypothetical protein